MTCNIGRRIARKAREQAEARGEADGFSFVVTRPELVTVAALHRLPVRAHAEQRAFTYGYTTLEAPDLRAEYLEAFLDGATSEARLRVAARATCRAIRALEGRA